jgi:predicted dehydrogenase
MEKVSIALIGCGIWGGRILADLQKIGAAVTVFDLQAPQQALEGVVFRTGLPVAEDRFDGLIVATPSTTHRAVLEAILPLGLPIFLEKPLTTNYADALALAGLTDDRVFLMHVWLYHPGIRLLGEIARSGELGEVLGVRSTRANWTSPRRDTDSTWNLAPHDLTIAKAILGFLPPPRAATIEYHGGVARGMIATLGRTPFATFEVSNRYERKIREVRLHCRGGVALLLDETVDYISIYRGDDASAAEDVREERRHFSGPAPLYAELEEFIAYLRGGPKPLCSFDDGLEVIRTLHELEQLARV